MNTMRMLLVLACCAAPATADVLYEQAPRSTGGSYMTAWWDPDGSNYDHYVWDAFTLPAGGTIRTVQWRGTYGPSGQAIDFTIGFYGSIPAGTQPDFSRPPLVEYVVGGDAGATFAGVFGGASMYDHSFTLPAPFVADAGIKYWVQIEAWQRAFPDWSIAAAQTGDGNYFLCEHNNLATATEGVPTGCWFTSRTGDAAFRLLSHVPVSVDDVAAGDLALGVVSNPSRGDRLEVRFALPDAGPARLGLYDVGGRCLRSIEVGAWGAGAHVLDFAAGQRVEPGIYFVRLARGVRTVETRVAVVR